MAEAVKFADHPARSHVLRLAADRRSTLSVLLTLFLKSAKLQSAGFAGRQNDVP